MCGVEESVEDALHECRFYAVIKHALVLEQISLVVSQGFQPICTDGSLKRTKSCKLPEIGGVGVYAPPLSPPQIVV